MPVIELEYGQGLSVSKLQVKLDSVKENNSLMVAADGLYVGSHGSSSSGKGNVELEAPTSNYSIWVAANPWGTESGYEKYICCSNTVHRCWTAEWDDPSSDVKLPINLTGKNPKDPMRPEIDWVLPGDFFRIKNTERSTESTPMYDYYLVTEVSPYAIKDRHPVCQGCGQDIYTTGIEVEFDPGTNEEQTDADAEEKRSPIYKGIIYPPEEDGGPPICEICGQPIYKHKTEDENFNEEEGLPGNSIAAYAYLGLAGEC